MSTSISQNVNRVCWQGGYILYVTPSVIYIIGEEERKSLCAGLSLSQNWNVTRGGKWRVKIF